MRLQIPLSLHIEKHESLVQDIILLAKKVIGQGGQTKVRTCVSLLTGKFFVRKKVSEHDRDCLVPLLKKQLFASKKPGIISIPVWRKITLHQFHPPLLFKEGEFLPADLSGIQLFEPLSEATLSESFGVHSELHSQASIKMTLIQDLLADLIFSTAKNILDLLYI